MRFLAVEKTAADEIISDRSLQSVDFENGRALSEFLQNLSLDVQVSPRLMVQRCQDGLFIVSVTGTGSDYVVFDLETCGLFEKQHSFADVLLYFQKVLRF